MSRHKTHFFSAGLIGAGAVVCALTGRPLHKNAETDIPLNILGVNRSPYGEVFAIAMQGPIDVYWHGGAAHEHAHGHDHDHDHEACSICGNHGVDCTEHVDSNEWDHDHDHAAHDHHHDHGHSHAHAETHGHDHDCEACEHNHHSGDEPSHAKPQTHELAAETAGSASRPQRTSVRNQFRDFLSNLEKARHVRTNPKPIAPAQDFHNRRQTEDKLRFAYQLDPAHYGNYNTYHFFITQPRIGTRPHLTAGAARLADETIRYCLEQDTDPRPALTAAAAAQNILDLMFNDLHEDKPTVTLEQMRRTLALVDHCLARYDDLSAEWDTSGNWELISPLRREEVATRHNFVRKIRDSAEQTIRRMEEESRFKNHEVSAR